MVTLVDVSPIPPSNAPAARQWLFDQCTGLIKSDSSDPRLSLLVCLDAPGPYQADDIVSIGDISLEYEPGSFVGSGGAGWLRERFLIKVDVDVYRGGDNAALTFTRAQLLADFVAAICRADLTMGGNVTTATPHSVDIESEWDDQHAGRHSVAKLEISCYAQR
jgi:hypothetical protein